MNWVNFLYIYQPPTQKKEILTKVINESYRPIMNMFIENPKYKLTLNINSGLTERILENGGEDIIEKIKILLKRKQIDITDTSAYQAFLPLMPLKEVIRQIEINHAMHKNIFGENYNPEGFFSPSLAYTEDIFNVIKDLNYKWMILDENTLNENIDHKKIYTHKGLDIYIRDRERSFRILSAQYDDSLNLIKNLEQKLSTDEFFISAMDGETFGHHKLNFEKTLEDLYASDKMKSFLMKDISKNIKDKKEINPKTSTWIIPSKGESDVFERWNNPSNKIQQKQIDLMEFAINIINSSVYKIEDPLVTNVQLEYLSSEQRTWMKARYILDQALYQDQLFYSSAKPSWNIELIENGSYLLNKAIDLVPDTSKKNKETAKKFYEYILFTALEWQKTNKVENIINEFFDEEKIPEEISSPKLHLQGYIDAIKRLRLEMNKAKEVEDYETCQTLKERIEEIEEKKENFKLE